MAFKARGKKLIIDEGDYGKGLPFTLSGDIEVNDKFIFRFSKSTKDPAILELVIEVDELNGNGGFSFDLIFDKEQSSKFRQGSYIYSLSQYRDGEFYDTLIGNEAFEVRGVA